MKTRIHPLLILLTVTALSSASAAASTPRRQHEARHEQPVPAAAVPQQAGTPLTGISSPDISAATSAATSAANTSQTDTSRTETLQTDTPQAPPTDSAVLTGDFTGHRAAAIDTPVMDSLLAGGGTLLSGQLPGHARPRPYSARRLGRHPRRPETLPAHAQADRPRDQPYPFYIQAGSGPSG